MQGKLIISYRRGDSADIAYRIADRLKERFGPDRVFIDIDSIPPGVDFADHLRHELDGCAALLAVIGKTWGGPRRGRSPRIMEDDDWVRLEVQTALERAVPVIPILVSGAQLPAPEALPPSLAPLLRRNALRIDSGRDFHAHADRLIRAIDDLVGVAPPPDPPPEVRPPPPPGRWQALRPIVAMAPVMALVLGLAWLLFLVAPALEAGMLTSDPGQMRTLDAAIRLSAVPDGLPFRLALAAFCAGVAVLAWFVDRRIGRALWLGVTATTLACLAAALFMFVYVRTEAFASSFALIPYPSSELSPIFAEGGDVTGLQDTLMGSFRLAISFGLVWNALVFLAMIRNKISHAPPARDKAVV